MAFGGQKEFRPVWIDYPETKKLVQLMGAPLCFRGGAIRDSLLGMTPRDIDLVVDLPKHEIIDRLENQGFKRLAEGENARTIITQLNGVEYDITSANPDDVVTASLIVKTSGAVPFDLTINSICLSEDGLLIDHYGGVEDLEAGRVRFVVDARARLQENSLRSLRFFRFYASYGHGDPDLETAKLCAEYVVRIHEHPPKLIDKNMFYLLLAPNPFPTLESMRSLGILDHIFGFKIKSCELVAKLEIAERISQIPPDSHSRLIALLLSADLTPFEALAQVRHAWEFPDDSYQWKYNLLAALPDVGANIPASKQQSMRNMLGDYAYKQLLLLGWMMESDPMSARPAYEAMLEMAV